MNVESLKKFIDEAAACLPEMRAGIINYEQNFALLAELQKARRHAFAIKGGAARLELVETGEIAREIENDLKILVQNKTRLEEEKASLILSKILLLENNLALLSGETEIRSTRAASPANLPENAGSRAGENEDFEIDAEMLEIFSHEAEDLLRNINAHLALLEKSPPHRRREALLEIRRSAHTLKGSAAIVGLKKLSALAHRIEDLLDFLAESETEGNAQIFDLLLAATDCLAAVAGGEVSLQLNSKIESVYVTFEKVLAELKTQKTTVAAKAEPFLRSEAAKEAENQTPQNQNSEPPDQVSAAGATDQQPAVTYDVNPNRAVVRVSLEKLNALFNLAGEMLTTRSVFEQRLDDLQRQLDELNHATRRIRAAADKLETDFEGGVITDSFVSPSSSAAAPFDFPAGQKNFLHALDPADFDALEFDRYTDFNQTSSELIETASDAAAINAGLDNLLDNFQLLFENQRRLFEGMQENLLRLRLVPLHSLAPRLQRTVRVTAQEEQKRVDFTIENGGLEIDAEILDSIVDPLLHILRNAVAHGIEPAETRKILGKPENGKITLRAFSEGTHVVFVISDDGRGISPSELKQKALQSRFISAPDAENMTDEEALLLIFLPGLTTAAVVNQVSGRGVGMNIVKANVARRQGAITVKSEAQKGTVFTIRVPVSLSITRAVLFKAGRQIFAFPLNLVGQITEIPAREFEEAAARKSFYFGGDQYSFFYFNRMLNFEETAPATKIPVILLKNTETRTAIAIDQILKTDEIVIKPLGAIVKNFPQFTGATILGDGTVVTVLDLIHLLKKSSEPSKSNARSDSSLAAFSAASAAACATPDSEKKILIVDDSPSVRQMNSNLIKNAGWMPIVARDGMEALEILQEMRGAPDAILTDVEMPRMDGYELLALLKKQSSPRRAIPVIMLTSRTGDKHRRKAFDLGADEYLTKPFEDAVLLEKIKILTRRGGD